MRPLAIIVAVAGNRVIGRNGALPWHLPEDLRHFRRVTMGHVVIMGRRTHESIGRALSGRVNIVVTGGGNIANGCIVAPSLTRALGVSAALDDEPIVIGGTRMYREALPLATRMHITHVDGEHAGDAHFPEYDATEWREASMKRGDACTFRELVRVAGHHVEGQHT